LLFQSRENKAKYRNVPIKPDSLRLAYLFAALIGTTGGTIAVATKVGEFFMLFPSAEAKQIYICDGLTATIVGKEKKDDVLQGTSGDDVIIGLRTTRYLAMAASTIYVVVQVMTKSLVAMVMTASVARLVMTTSMVAMVMTHSLARLVMTSLMVAQTLTTVTEEQTLILALI
jgi:hypothetical protein